MEQPFVNKYDTLSSLIGLTRVFGDIEAGTSWLAIDGVMALSNIEVSMLIDKVFWVVFDGWTLFSIELWKLFDVGTLFDSVASVPLDLEVGVQFDFESWVLINAFVPFVI